MANSTTLRLTPEEKFNGWTVESLTRYRAERDKAAGVGFQHPDAPSDVVDGYQVTEYRRRPPPIRIETALAYDPHRRK